MELIIKPTARCNFSCKFCSAGNLCIQHHDTLSPQLREVLLQTSPTNVIITGGDPLCCSPSLYDEILQLGDWNISLTTNLKVFYEDPDKWLPLFKSPRVRVCTSFQYGIGRMWDNETPYDEQMFRKVFFKFKSLVGRSVKFISVISKENEDRALDHLLLAKSLGTKCKLNGVMPLGKSKELYPQHKLIKIWLDAFSQGLQDYMDCNTALFHGGCNLNINGLCESTIRAAMVKDGNLVVTSCEDDLVQEVPCTLSKSKWNEEPSRAAISFSDTVTEDCPLCELFYICNGCHQYRKSNKEVPDHCQQMQKLKGQILASGWKTQ